jgi:hypothetical protein
MPNPSFRSSSNGSGSLSNFSVNKPAGTIDGDFLVAFQASRAETPSPPSGWSLVGTVGAYNGGIGSLQGYYKVASGEPASYTFNCSIGDSLAYIVTIQNGSAKDSSAATSTTGTSTAHAGGATASQASDIVLCAFAAAVNAAAFSPDGGLTDLGTITLSSDNSLDVAYKTQSGSGASGTFNAPFSNGPADNAGVIVLVRGSVTSTGGRRGSVLGSGRKWGKFEHHEKREIIEICLPSIYPFPLAKSA